MYATNQRLDQELVRRGLAPSRSQAESYIRLGAVYVDGTAVTKAGFLVRPSARVELRMKEQYVSRAGLKLASVADIFTLSFKNKLVLDVGSSTGGFSDYALRHGARKVIAVELGTDQMHPSLRANERLELHEKTDIRDVWLRGVAAAKKTVVLASSPDIIVIDVSFISLREILPHIARLSSPKTLIVAMCKPQFEAEQDSIKHKGVIKNDALRRSILKSFEAWLLPHFLIVSKADSAVAGAKGNRERFYLLRTLTEHSV